MLPIDESLCDPAQSNRIALVASARSAFRRLNKRRWPWHRIGSVLDQTDAEQEAMLAVLRQSRCHLEVHLRWVRRTVLHALIDLARRLRASVRHELCPTSSLIDPDQRGTAPDYFDPLALAIASELTRDVLTVAECSGGAVLKLVKIILHEGCSTAEASRRAGMSERSGRRVLARVCSAICTKRSDDSKRRLETTTRNDDSKRRLETTTRNDDSKRRHDRLMALASRN